MSTSGSVPNAGPWSVERADWLEFVGSLPRAGVDLLYVDPPFNTGKARRTPRGAAKVSGRGAMAAYSDAWPTMDAYVAWMRTRLEATLPVLAPSAGLLLHCDWRASHHLRLLLDEVLGPEAFVNHLVWSYGLGGSSPRAFARKHDDILYYARTPGRHWFQAPRVPATSNRLRGTTKKATDVLVIPSLNNMSKERTGYPTQKPLALLELLVGACCPPGGTVLDPCCGSGTTLVAALQLGRAALGCDLSLKAVRLATARLGNQLPRR